MSNELEIVDRTSRPAQSHPFNSKTRSGAWLDLLLLVILYLSALRLTGHVAELIPLLSDDEAGYMWSGITLGQGPLGAQWGPVYAVWYRVLFWLTRDPIRCYYLNWVLTTALPPMALFLAMRSLRVTPFVAWLGSFIALLMSHLFLVWPRVNNYAAFIALFGLFAASRLKLPATQFAVLGLTALVMAYIRPEFTLSFGLMAGGAFALGMIGKSPFPRPALLSWAAIGVLLLWATLAVGFPLKGGRSDLAFRQHFAANWKLWTNSTRSPWFEEDELFAEAFGTERTFAGALRTNPPMVARHVLVNTRGLFANAAWQIAYHEPVVWRRESGYSLEKWLLTALMLGSIAISPFRSWARFTDSLQARPVLWFGILAFLIPPLVSAVLISPRGHYLLPLYLFFLLAWAVALPRWLTDARILPASIALASLMLTPQIKGKGDPGGLGPAISLIRERQQHVAVRLLEFGHAAPFLSPETVRYDGRSDPRPFAELTESAGVNLVLIEDPVRVPSRWKEDHQWQHFISFPGDYHFQEVQAGSSRVYLKSE